MAEVTDLVTKHIYQIINLKEGEQEDTMGTVNKFKKS